MTAQPIISKLFDIRYPIIQAGMIWCSGWELASAVSNAGGLGLIGSGSMDPDTLRVHIHRCRAATHKPFGVNMPLLYFQTDAVAELLVQEKIPIVFTSAGNPAKYTAYFKSHGITVVHVVANLKYALRAEEAGVDAIVAEGFEAGGHNGIEETTTMALIPLLREKIHIPIIAAGGIASGAQMLAAFALGADGVQIGSLFASSEESSCHQAFKQAIVEAKDGSTMLMMKKVVPVRLLKNPFFDVIQNAEQFGASVVELREILGKGRAKKGMFEGDLVEGELEIGQVAAMIHAVNSVQDIFETLITGYNSAKQNHLPDFH